MCVCVCVCVCLIYEYVCVNMLHVWKNGVEKESSVWVEEVVE